MIRPCFLTPEDRAALVDLAQAGLVEHRVARRANALVLLDGGLSCEMIAKVLLIDDDTIRGWHKLYAARGLEGLAQPGRRVTLHFVPAYCPHLNPIERLWGATHKHLTHNKTYATYREFADATLEFLREKVPQNWLQLCDLVTDNFRVINPKDFRVLT